MMRSAMKMSGVWLAGLLVGCAGVLSAHGETNTTYTLSFENYVVRGTTYSVSSITGLVSGAALPKLKPSTLHEWLLGWADAGNTKYYDKDGNPLVAFTAETNVALHALIDMSVLSHTLSFADYRVAGKTYSIPPMTYQEGRALTSLPESVVFEWNMGWYTGEDGTGTQYYDHQGKPVVATFTAETDVTLYAKLDPQYLPYGVSVNGQEIDAVTEEGRRGEGWSYDVANRLVTLSGTTTYSISGKQVNDRIHFRVATNATVVVSNLFLKTTSTAHPGLFDVAKGAKVDLELQGVNSIDASAAAGVAGIFCPRGATVTILTRRKRDLELVDATNMTYHGVLFDREFATKDLTVKGGASAAAIGGRQSSDVGLSGRIIVQNCSLWVQGGSGACDVGAGHSSFTTAETNACGMVRFTSNSNVRYPDQRATSVPRVCPRPHGDWETPVFPCVVQSENDDVGTVYNVFWFPYGTTRVKTLAFSPEGGVTTNEVSYTVAHH